MARMRPKPRATPDDLAFGVHACELALRQGLAKRLLHAEGASNPRVAALATGAEGPPAQPADAVQLVFVDEAGRLNRTQTDELDAKLYTVETPRNISALKSADLERAKAWQLHLRGAITDLLAAGYVVSGFTRDERRAWYLLSRES